MNWMFLVRFKLIKLPIVCEVFEKTDYLKLICRQKRKKLFGEGFYFKGIYQSLINKCCFHSLLALL